MPRRWTSTTSRSAAEADRAHQELEEAQRKKNEIDAQAKADTEAYRQAASAPGGAPVSGAPKTPSKSSRGPCP
jgi:hypothetical protein